MKLEQDLGDTKKVYAENKNTLEHWSIEHDKLQLEDVEYVCGGTGSLAGILIRYIATKTMR